MRSFFLLIIISSFSAAIYAQTGNIQSATNIAKSFSNKSSELNYLAKQGFQIDQSAISNSGVYVSQVGNDNRINTNINAVFTNVNLIQKGDFNEVFIEVTAQVLNETVIQDGDNHSFLDFSNNNAEFHGAEILQAGTDQNLVWFGNNSISEKLKVEMRGQSKSITVRNFN